MSYREYCVVIEKGEDLSAIEQELTAPTGGEYSPNRSVTISDPKPGSRRVTIFLLSDEEAEQLENDPRILAVDIPPEQKTDLTVELDTVYFPYTQTENWQRLPTSVIYEHANWGLYHASFDGNPYDGSDPSFTAPITSYRDGTGVDVVIMDSGIDPDHEEWEDPDGNSRLRQIDWYEAAGTAGTMPLEFYRDYEGHGTHVASTVAGKVFGFLKNADIYSMKSLPGSGDPYGGISISSAFDLMRLWHLRKNDPNDPIYTGRPTVVNMSWGTSYNTTSNPTSGTYRGTSWTFGDPGYSTEQELWDSVGLPERNTLGQYSIPGNNPVYDAELADMADTPGMVVICSSGNRSAKCPISAADDIDFDNRINFPTSSNRQYHKPGSPYDDKVFFVGAMGPTSALTGGGQWFNQPAGFSDRGSSVNIWAPGMWISAAASTDSSRTDYLYRGTPGSPDRQTYMAGTSMAAPNVSGVVGMHMQTQRSAVFDDIFFRMVTEDGNITMYDEGDVTAYSDTLNQLLGSTGNTLVSRYRISQNEFLPDVTIATSSGNQTPVSTPVTVNVRPFLSNVAVTNLRSITITQQPANGSATVTDNLLGNITYTPNNGYVGTDLLNYTVENTLGNVSSTGSISFLVGGAPPMAFLTDDFVVVQSGGSTVIDVLANDDKANADVTTVAINTAPTFGSVAVNPVTGNITYTPDTGVLYGSDTFTYDVTGLNGTVYTGTTTNIKINQQVAVTNFSTTADTVQGTTIIDVANVLTSYDPYVSSTYMLFDFEGANPNTNKSQSVSASGDIVIPAGQQEVVENEGNYDFTSLHFPEGKTLNAEATVSRGSLPSNFFNTTEWTIEVDYKFYGLNTAGLEHIFGGTQTSTPYDFRAFFNTSGGQLTFNWMVPYDNGGAQSGLISIPVSENTWTHAVMMRKDDTIYGFINGELVKSTAVVTSFSYDDFPTTLKIGGWKNNTDNRLSGTYVDNIRITGNARYPIDGFEPRIQRFPVDNTERADLSTLTITKQPTHGSATATVNGTIEYTPITEYNGDDYIEYSIDSINPTTSGNGNISVSVFSSLVPTYSNVLVSPTSIDEDGSSVTFTVNTENVVDATTVGYTIAGTGITVDDISLASLTGTFTINANTDAVTFQVLADNLTEGVETLTLTLDATDSNGDGTGSIGNVLTINDTSVSPPGYTSATFNRLSVNEDGGQPSPTLVRFIVVTSSITDGTTVGYTLSGTGITAGDVSVPLSGTITINSDQGSLDFYVNEDNLTEGPETLIATLNPTDSLGNPTGSLTDSIVINDTSLTPGSYDAAYFNLASVPEDGTTLVTFTVETTGVSDGAVVGYAISGTNITVDDISLTSLTGSMGISSDVGTLSFTVNPDSLTEGDETLTITLDSNDDLGNPTNDIANSIILIDTSTSPIPGTPTYNSVSFDRVSADEDGTIVTFTVNTTDVVTGTFVGFTVSGSGITVGDTSLVSLTGSLGLYNNVGTLAFSVTQDFLTEGDETLTITLNPTDSNGDPTGSLSADVLLVDTSKTPAYLDASFDVAQITEDGLQTATFTVTTENVLDNTTVGYTVTGVTEADISLTSLTGLIVITGNTGSVSFTANPDLTTETTEAAIITLNSADSQGSPTGSLSDSVLILDTSIDPVFPPVTFDVSDETVQRRSVLIDLTPFIGDPDSGDIISLDFPTGPSNGSITSNLGVVFANVTYTPNPDFYGNDTITYNVTDEDSLVSNTSNITVRVYEVPTAVDDFATLDINTSVDINVVSNDIEGENGLDVTTVDVTTSPANGTVINLNNGVLRYIPAIGYFGNDLISYTVSDFSGGLSYPANVNITVFSDVQEPNLPPVPVDDSAFVAINSSVLINVVANDFDLEDTIDPSTVTIVTPPINGTVQTFANGFVQYTPTIGYDGPDSFQYIVADSEGLFSTSNATVSITVLAAPIAVDDSATIYRNQEAQIFVPGNDIETDGNIDVTTVVITTPASNGLAFANEVTGFVTYLPNTNFVGGDSFEYAIRDEFGIISGPATVTINVLQPLPFGGTPLLQSIEFVEQGLAVDEQPNIREFTQKIIPGIDIENTSINMGYFYDNLTLLYSPSKVPNYKWAGYNPNVYPRANPADKIPLRFSDFIGYLNYYLPFPDPRVSIYSMDGVTDQGVTGYTNYVFDYKINAKFFVDFYRARWPVPPRPSPSSYQYKYDVQYRWYRDNVFIGGDTLANNEDFRRITISSPALSSGSVVKTYTIKLEVIATLYGPDDTVISQVKDDASYIHAANTGVKDTKFKVIVYDPPKATTTVEELDANNDDTHTIRTYKRLVDDTLVKISNNEIKFKNNPETGYNISFPEAFGRSATNVAEYKWQRKFPNGDWFDDNTGAYTTTVNSWTDTRGYDGVGESDFTAHQIRYRARGKQQLQDPTETKTGEWAYTAPVTLNYSTTILPPIFVLEGKRNVIKGGTVNLKFRPYNMGAGSTTYYWRIVEAGAFTNEYVTQSGSFSLNENIFINFAPDSPNEGTITSTIAVGDSETRTYIIEFYTNATYTGTPIYEDVLKTIFATPNVDVTAKYPKRTGVDTYKSVKEDVANHAIIETVEEGIVNLFVYMKNYPYVVGDTIYLENNRIVADGTAGNDIQYLDGDDFIPINSGTRFPMTCTDVQVTETDYIPLFKRSFIGFDDSPGGGSATNYERFKFDVYAAPSGGSSLQNFKIDFYDKFEFFFDITGSLVIDKEPIVYTTNNVLEKAGSGQLRWDTFDPTTNTGNNKWYYLNPGPTYTSLAVNTTWQYSIDRRRWVSFQIGNKYDPLRSVSTALGDGDEGFSLANVTDTLVGGYDFASGIWFRVRATVQNLADNTTITTAYSNEVKFTITNDNTVDNTGLNSLFPLNSTEGSTTFTLRIMSFNMKNRKVRVQMTNNYEYFAGEYVADVTITGNSTDVALPDIPLYPYYDPNASETITVTDISGAAAPGYTQKSVPFSITQGDYILSAKRINYYRYHDSSTLQETFGDNVTLEEGNKLDFRARFANPTSNNVKFYLQKLYLDGVLQDNSKITDFFTMSPTGTDGSGRPYVTTALSYEVANPTKASQKVYYYLGQASVTPVVTTNYAGSISVQYYWAQENGVFIEGSSGTIVVESYLPEPWVPSDGALTITARPTGGVKENGRKVANNAFDDYVPGAAYFLASANGSAPAGTTVYWRVKSNSTAVEGVHYSNPNDATLTVDLDDGITQTRTGVRADKTGAANTPLYFPVIDDGVYDSNKTLNIEMSYFSNFSTVFSASASIVNVQPEPIPSPVVNLPTTFNTGLLYITVTEQGFSAGPVPTGQSFSISVDADGTIKTLSGNQSALTTYSTWLPSGENASDYEWKVSYVNSTTKPIDVNSTGDFGVYTSSTFAASWFVSINNAVEQGGYADTSTAITVEIRAKADNSIKSSDRGTLFYALDLSQYTTADVPVDDGGGDGGGDGDGDGGGGGGGSTGDPTNPGDTPAFDPA